MKAQGELDARVHIFAATTLARGKVDSLKLCHLYPMGGPSTHFCMRLSGHQGQSDMKRQSCQIGR